MVGTVDVLLGNLEDAVKADNKEAARAGPGRGRQGDRLRPTPSSGPGSTPSTARGCSTTSPPLVTEIGDKLDVIMVPEGRGRRGHPLRRPAARPARGQGRPDAADPRPRDPRDRPRRGQRRGDLRRLARACRASRLGPADLAADRRMKTTRVGGGHPGYLVRAGPGRPRRHRRPPRATYQQDLWHYTIARMVDACAMHGIFPYYGPFGDIEDSVACEDQFRNAFLLGCVGAWSLHPVQIDDRQAGLQPRAPRTSRTPARVVAAMGDGTGAVMLDGKMEDDASVKQCQVMVELAEQLAANDPELEGAVRRDRAGRRVSATESQLPPPPLASSTCPAPTSGRSRRPRRSPCDGADPRPRGRRRPRRQAGRPRARLRGRRVAASTAAARSRSASTASAPSGTTTTWRPPAPAGPDAIVVPRSTAPTRSCSWSTAMERPAPPSTRALWAMVETPVRHARTPRRSPRASERLDRARDGHQRPRQGAVRRARARPRSRCCPASALALLAARAAGKAILDGVYNDVKDAEGFLAECRAGPRDGLRRQDADPPRPGRGAPTTPSPRREQAVEDARGHHRRPGRTGQGSGVVTYNGRMVENLHVESAAAHARHPRGDPGAGRV